VPTTPKAIREYLYKKERNRLGLSDESVNEPPEYKDDGSGELAEPVEQHNPTGRAQTMGPEDMAYTWHAGASTANNDRPLYRQPPSPAPSNSTNLSTTAAVRKSILKRNPTPDSHAHSAWTNSSVMGDDDASSLASTFISAGSTNPRGLLSRYDSPSNKALLYEQANGTNGSGQILNKVRMGVIS